MQVLTDVSYTRAVDWWGLGVLIYEMLVGEVRWGREGGRGEDGECGRGGGGGKGSVGEVRMGEGRGVWER